MTSHYTPSRRDFLKEMLAFSATVAAARAAQGSAAAALPTDFYHQTLYRPDTYVREGLEESLATIEKLDKPVVAYKVLGAGRLAPADTLPYIFKRLRPKDGICVGVFPKTRDELAENAALTRRLSKGGID